MFPHKMDDLLRMTVEQGASDLHIVVGSAPMIRLHGELSAVVPDKISPSVAQELIASLMERGDQSTLEEHREVDFAYSLPGVSRFRINACFQRDSLSAVLRAIPGNPPMLEKMGLPAVVEAQDCVAAA